MKKQRKKEQGLIRWLLSAVLVIALVLNATSPITITYAKSESSKELENTQTTETVDETENPTEETESSTETDEVPPEENETPEESEAEETLPKEEDEAPAEEVPAEEAAANAIETSVCKIGNVGYDSLQGAIDAINAGTAAAEGSNPYYKIKMLIDEYEITQEYSIPDGKRVSITTASASDSVLPYRGTRDTAMLKRNPSCNVSIFNVSSSAQLFLQEITLDGGWGGLGTEPAPMTSPMIIVKGSCNLNNQAILQNGYNTFADVGASGSYPAGAMMGTTGSKIGMTEGSKITNCASASAGAAIISNNGFVCLEGGSIDSCYVTATNDRTNNGVAVHMYGSEAYFKMVNGIITNNYNMSAKAAVNAGAVQVNGGTARILGGTITGNYTTGNGGGIGQGSNAAMIIVGGNAVINGNYGGSTFSGYKVTNQGKANNAYITQNINVENTLEDSAQIGITYEGHMSMGNQFGVVVASPASDSPNLKIFRSDDIGLFGVAGTDNKVIWNDAVCKIGSVGYGSLQGALEAINAGTATDIEGIAGLEQIKYKIEMLIDEYEITQEYSIPDGKRVSITTASASDSVLPYRGTKDTAMLKRNPSFNVSIFNVNSSAQLFLQEITLDGGWDGPGTEPAPMTSPMIIVKGSCNLNNQAILQNGYNTFADIGTSGSYPAGAMMSTAGSKIRMTEGSKITNCASASAGAAIISNNGSVRLDGGSIESCYVTATNDRTNNGVAVHMYGSEANFEMVNGIITNNYNMSAKAAINAGAVQVNGGTARILGGTITGNYTTGNGGGIGQGSNAAKIIVGGNAVISGNYGGSTYSGYEVTDQGKANNAYITQNINAENTLKDSAQIGITYEGHMSVGNQFGIVATVPASDCPNLKIFRSDDIGLFGVAGTDNKVIWNDAVCKIGGVGYGSIQGALEAINAGTATDIGGIAGSEQMEYKIEMLVDEYETIQEHIIPQNKNVTITTASAKDLILPYKGTNEVAVLKRNTSFNTSIFRVPEGSSLSVEKITLDGGWGGAGTDSVPITHAMIEVGGECTLKDKAILQNGYNTTVDIGGTAAGYHTAGAIVGTTSNSVIVVKDGSRITNCASASAGGAIVSKGGTVRMTGGLIDSCYATAINDRTNNGAAIHMCEATAEFTMTGGTIAQNYNMSAKADINGGAVQINGGKATITGGYIIGNRTTGNGGGIAQGSSDAEINIGASAYISQNYGNCTFSEKDYKVISTGKKSNAYIINSVNVVSPLTKTVGITVPESNHISGYDFAQAVGKDETDSKAIASASYGKFLDDYNPGLKIGVDPDDLTKIYFTKQTTQQLSISKTVAGSHGDKSQSFDINITLKTDETGSPLKAGTQFSYVGAGGAADGVLTLDENGVGTITLKDGQAITIEGLDKGVYYIIEEVVAEGVKNSAYGYAVSYDGVNTANSLGTLTDNTKVAITNTRTIVPTAVATAVKGLIILLVVCSLAGALFFAYCRRKKNV